MATDTLVKDIYHMIDTKEIPDGVDVEEAIETFWVLGDYLEKGKVVKQKVHPDVKIRKKLLSKCVLICLYGVEVLIICSIEPL